MHSGLKSVAATLLSATTLAAVAADQTFTDQALFQAAAGPLSIESFESTAARTRSGDAVVTPLLTVAPTATLIGVQSSSTTPQDGFGSHPVLGSQYLFNYNPNLPSGTLKFTFSAPTTAFGFVMTDVGEADGTVSLRTNTGAFTADQVLATYPPLQGNGASFFFGLTQTVAFTEAYVTVNGVDEAYGIDAVRVTAVPEPAQGALLLAGLGLLGAIARRRATA